MLVIGLCVPTVLASNLTLMCVETVPKIMDHGRHAPRNNLVDRFHETYQSGEFPVPMDEIPVRAKKFPVPR